MQWLTQGVLRIQLTSEAIGHIKPVEGEKHVSGTLGIIVPFEYIDTVKERVFTTPLFEKEKNNE